MPQTPRAAGSSVATPILWQWEGAGASAALSWGFTITHASRLAGEEACAPATPSTLRLPGALGWQR